MPDLTPIPIPPAERWREFRFHVLPLLVFCGGLVAVFQVWRTNVSAPNLVGQVEPTVADVKSPNAGFLTNLFVTRFQKVKAGDVIGELVATDVRLWDSEMARLRGNVEVTQTELSTEINREKLSFDHQNMRLDYLKFRVELATARVELQSAEAELIRAADLHKKELLSQADYEIALRNRDVFKTKVDEISLLVDDVKLRLDQSHALLERFPKSGGAPLAKIIGNMEADRERWQSLKIAPISLRAPITGTISMIYRRNGENVIAGESILTISSDSSERIITFLRQPLPFEPAEKMTVKVRLRSRQREESFSQILQVGTLLEPVIPALARPGVFFELGLPVAISIPPLLKPRPGELVDLQIIPAQN